MNPSQWGDLIPPLHRSHLEHIISTIESHGGEAYLVGGSVRDLALGKIPNEFDLTTSLTPQAIKKLFKRVIETGIEHGTVTVLLDHIPYEVTTYRSESGYTDNRRPDQVEFGVSLSEDLSRRDFTMNALAFNPLSHTFVDEHGGLEDMENRTIRTIGNPVDRFTEDGLRPIRAIRFTSVLGFELEENTKKAMDQVRSTTAKVAIERFLQEWRKILQSSKPYTALSLLKEHKIPELFSPLLGMQVGDTDRSTSGSLPNHHGNQMEELWKEILNQSKPHLALRQFLSLMYFWDGGDGYITSPSLDSFGNGAGNRFREGLPSLRLSHSLGRTLQYFLGLWLYMNQLGLPSTDYEIRKNILAPYKKERILWKPEEDFSLEVTTQLLWFQQILSHFHKTQGQTELKSLNSSSVFAFFHDILSKESSKLIQIEFLWKENPPLLVKDLSIDGNWLKSELSLRGEEIGIQLQNALDFVWKHPHSNTKQEIKIHLSSFPL